MLSSDVFAIDEVAIAAVCGERWRESQTLEFKATLPATDDRARNEFLKDVCALANSSGGDIVYGIRENAGHADAPTPIPVASFPVDVTKRRLAQILESGLEPRLAVQMHPVPFASGDYVLIVRVPASFQRPHRYKMQQHIYGERMITRVMSYPPAWCLALFATQNPAEVARPLLDTLWQSFGIEQCGFYNAQGTWQLYN